MSSSPCMYLAQESACQNRVSMNMPRPSVAGTPYSVASVSLHGRPALEPPITRCLAPPEGRVLLTNRVLLIMLIAIGIYSVGVVGLLLDHRRGRGRLIHEPFHGMADPY
jgi:hypothetical protein